jgi:endonuclease/exonuclease/phosphatase family metal-dependent hydrolase
MSNCLVPVTLSLWAVFRIIGYITEPTLSDADIHRVRGEQSRTSLSAGLPQSVRVATWNIQRGVKFDNILAALRSMDADVIFLQEVDLFCRRSGYRDVAQDLAHALDVNWVAAGEFQEVGEGRTDAAATTGQAVLSKYPITEVATIVFAEQVRVRWRLDPAQPRRGGRLALRVRSAGLLGYNVHLESRGNDALRRDQLNQLLENEKEQGARDPTVIAGDFNNPPAARSRIFDGLKPSGFVDALGSPETRRTTVNRIHGIDWIFVKNLEPSAGQVITVEDASDHYPLVATVGLR